MKNDSDKSIVVKSIEWIDDNTLLVESDEGRFYKLTNVKLEGITSDLEYKPKLKEVNLSYKC